MNILSQRFHAFKSASILSYVLSFLLLLAIIAILVPLTPPMPEVTDSEKFAMNYAVSQGMVVGKDVIYTYGPYSSIYSGQYFPDIDFRMVVCCLYLAFSFWIALALLSKNVDWRWIFGLFLILSGLIYWRDVLLLAIPFLVGLTVFKELATKDKQGWLQNKYAPLYIAILFAPFGLLPLTKGTILLTCTAVSAFCALVLFVNRYKALAIICLLTPITSMLLFWLASGQSLGNLYGYFNSMNSVISGYTNAMSVFGKPFEVISYLASALLLLITIYRQKDIQQKYFLIGIYSIFLFISFKGGFVRHDAHALLSAASLLLAALLLPFVGVRSKFFLFAITFSLFSVAYIYSNHTRITPKSYFNFAKVNYSNAYNGIKNRIENKDWLIKQYEEALSKIRANVNSPPHLQGKTDIYSYNQAYIFAYGYQWSPRPAFQSYTAYTPELAELNKKHLEGANAPDNIIFGMNPIDERLPSIEDGASWPLLLAQYKPTKLISEYLFLEKKNGVATSPLQWTNGQIFRLGQIVDLPKSPQPLFAKIIIKPNLFGRIKTILFKPAQLSISLRMADGSTKQFRLIAGMTTEGIMLSPLIETTAEFNGLYLQDKLLDKKLVRSFMIESKHGSKMDWDKEYVVIFNKMPND